MIALLNRKGSVTVSELKERFKVSVDTIRRDLAALERQSLLRRTHGGAVKAGLAAPMTTFRERAVTRIEEKREIARVCASLCIQEGDSLFLDGSTTVTSLVPFLSSFSSLIVHTNSLIVARECCLYLPTFPLHIHGVTVNTEDQNTYGASLLQSIKDLFVNKVLLSPCSLDLEAGIYASYHEEAVTKRELLRAGEQAILLVDSGKLNLRQRVRFARLEPGQVLITESAAPVDLVKQLAALAKKGLTVYVGRHRLQGLEPANP